MNTPSPVSDTHMPAHRRRKSRWRSGDSRRAWSGRMRGGGLARGAQVLERAVYVHRAGEEEALTQVAAEVAQRRPLVVVLDPLCDHVELERLAEAYDHAGQCRGLRGRAGAQERAVHLEDVDRKLAEI